MGVKVTMPRFQFTISGLLWATFWVAMSLGAWSLFFEFKGLWNESRPRYGAGFLPPLVPRSVELAMAASFMVGLLAPLMAGGALFGRTVRGLLWGLGIIAICYVLIPFVVLR